MNLTFNEVMEFTRTVSSNAAFEDPECLEYYHVLNGLNGYATVIEIGLQYGRSSAVALQIAKFKPFHYIGIDPFIGHQEVRRSWEDMARRVGSAYNLHIIPSREFRTQIKNFIDCVLIDGDHSYNGVRADCENFLPYVKHDGYALFHDYGRDSLPEVYAAVSEYMKHHDREWELVNHVGCLGVFKRVA